MDEWHPKDGGMDIIYLFIMYQGAFTTLQPDTVGLRLCDVLCDAQ
jgi:hypothetical protein